MKPSWCHKTPGILGAVPLAFLPGALNRAETVCLSLSPKLFEDESEAPFTGTS